MPKLSSKPNETFLSVSNVVDIARSEFAFVHIDNPRGMEFVARQVLQQGRTLSHEAIDAALAPLADSIEMIVADDPHSDRDFLKCFVVPNSSIEIAYVFDGHETHCRPLIHRLASALNYEFVSD
jgi:hypothetical protein